MYYLCTSLAHYIGNHTVIDLLRRKGLPIRHVAAGENLDNIFKGKYECVCVCVCVCVSVCVAFLFLPLQHLVSPLLADRRLRGRVDAQTGSG